MRCTHCHSLMLETAQVREGLSEQTWYECPLCGRTQLYSRRLPTADNRDGQTREDPRRAKSFQHRY